VAHVGPVQRDGPGRPADGQRRPGGEAEVGVDDVEPGAAVTPSQPRGRARVVAGREREDLEVDAWQRPQGVPSPFGFAHTMAWANHSASRCFPIPRGP